MKKILLSAAALAVSFGAFAQIVIVPNDELAGNQATETNNGYKYEFNTNAENDDQTINCTDAGPIWDTYNNNGGVDNFNINSEGQLEISLLEITGADADANTRHSANRFYQDQCSNMTAAPVDMSGHKTVSARVKSSVDVNIVIFAATLDGGQWILNDGSIDTIQLAAGADFRDVTKSLSETGSAGTGDLSATIGWELFIQGNVSAGTLTFDEIAFGDAELTEINNVNVVNNSEFNVFPNPASDVLTVELDAVNASNIELTDISGKVVANQNVSAGPNTVNFNVNNLSAGLYFVSVKSEGGVVTTKVLVK